MGVACGQFEDHENQDQRGIHYLLGVPEPRQAGSDVAYS